MKCLEFHANIMKIMKKIIFPLQNNANYEIHRIPCHNNKKSWTFMKFNENVWISRKPWNIYDNQIIFMEHVWNIHKNAWQSWTSMKMYNIYVFLCKIRKTYRSHIEGNEVKKNLEPEKWSDQSCGKSVRRRPYFG